MTELLLEFYSTEIPAKMQKRASADFKRLLQNAFKERTLAFTDVQTYVSPCHLTAVVSGLPLAQENRVEEKKGPRVDAPEKAIEGFLKGQGVTRDQCIEKETKKGTFLFVEINHQGRAVEALVPEIVEELIDGFPWPKSMTWGCGSRKWVRPLKSGLALFNGKKIAFDVSFGAKDKPHAPVIAFGDQTTGHRVMAPESFTVKDFEDYQQSLRERYVLVDQHERKAKITQQIQDLEQKHSFKAVTDEDLLDEVTGLVEWPVSYLGSIEDAYMTLPPEVLMTSMKVHQRYFAVSDGQDGLAPHFIVVANLPTTDHGATVVKGNENVLKARLSDARFFYDVDCKTKLLEHGKTLDRLIFHTQLGSLAQKTDRVALLATRLADQLHVNSEDVQQAARLMKCDLVTEMVGEFPELQGVMGKYYALKEGFSAQIAQGIEEHYWPKGADDQCPQSAIGKILALADRFDTLVGFFAIGIQPTGSKDPFALRRACLGIIRILENEFDLKFEDLIRFAYDNYTAIFTKLESVKSADETVENLLNFFKDRLKVYWRDQGLRYDYIAASFAVGGQDSLYVLKDRIQALSQFMQGDQTGVDLLAGYRRAVNILRIEEKKDQVAYNNPVDSSLFIEESESALYNGLQIATGKIEPALKKLLFKEAMTEIAELRPVVDGYFETVIVNADDPKIRENRLNMLATFRVTMEQVADFSLIEDA